MIVVADSSPFLGHINIGRVDLHATLFGRVIIPSEALDEHRDRYRRGIMPKADRISVPIEPKLKADAERILDELGLGADDAIRVFYKQVVLRRGLPFDLAVPNEATRRAMREVRRGHGLSRYKDVAALREELGM